MCKLVRPICIIAKVSVESLFTNIALYSLKVGAYRP